MPQGDEFASGMHIDADSPTGLQRQIRQQLVEGIFAGRIAPGRRLPSSRQLARQLGVARNTVLLAYQELIDEGHIIARPRSGLYLNAALGKQVGGVAGSGSWHARPRRLTGRPGCGAAPASPRFSATRGIGSATPIRSSTVASINRCFPTASGAMPAASH